MAAWLRYTQCHSNLKNAEICNSVTDIPFDLEHATFIIIFVSHASQGDS